MSVFSLTRKMALLLFVIALSLLTACKEKNPVEEYGTGLIHSYQKSQDAAETANLDAIKKSLQQYRAEHEEYPRSLKDIENMAGVLIDPDRYDYNPQTGSVSLKSK
jgi:hypothetical protein